MAMAEYFSSLAVSLNPQSRNIAWQADTMLMAGQFQHFSQAVVVHVWMLCDFSPAKFR